MMDKDYCIAELREAEWILYRTQCRVRCLEANLDRIVPEDFEPLMESLETARLELLDAERRATRARVSLCECEKKPPSTGNTGQL